MKKLLALLFFCSIFLSLSEKATAQDSCGVTVWQDTSAVPDLILYASANGTPPFTYVWSTGDSLATIQVYDTISYCVTITDAAGCIASGCITPVIDNANNCWAGIIEDSTPAGGSLIGLAGGVPPFEYYWSTGDTSQIIYPNAPGLYCLYIIDATGCTSAQSCLYYQGNPPPDSCYAYILGIPGPNGGDDLCAYSDGVGPFTYLWSTGDTSWLISVSQPGNYCVTVVDANDCEAEACYYFDGINPIDSCEASIVALGIGGGESLCAYSTGPGPYTYNWSTGETTFLITVNQPGDYCVTVVDANGCEASTCYYFNGNNPVDSCFVYLIGQDSPNGGILLNAIANGNPDFNYHWSTGDTSQQIAVFTAGDYCVTVVDYTGCQASACYYYDGANPVDSCEASIVALGTSGGETLCAYSTGPAGYTYNWSTGETTFLITVNQPGTYCVTVVDANGCEASTCYYYDGTNPVDSCSVFIAGDSLGFYDGIIWAAPTGVAPFSYLWNTGETTSSIQVTTAGEYCVTVVDAVGCQASFCTYAYPAQGGDSCSVTIIPYIDTSQVGGIYVEAIPSGLGPFTYQWNTGETTPLLWVNLPDTTVCVTVTNSLGCVATDCFYYDGNSNNCSVIIYEDTTSAGTILVADTPVNGPVPFSYLWSTGETTQQIAVTAPGTYCVTLTDGSGCEAYACYTYTGAGFNNVCGYVFLADSTLLIGSTTVSLYLLENGGTTLVDEQYFQGEDYFWYYDFTVLADGDYIVKAAIDAGAAGADDYVPTYHFSALLWDQADVISVPNNNNFCNGLIVMQPDGGINGNGNGSVAGNVTDLYGPLAGVTILIYDEFGNLLDYIYTDANGEFSFLNLPFGTYQIVIEYTGYNHASYWVTLTDDTPRVIDLTFEVLDGAISTGTFETAPATSLQAYPNPVTDLLNIQLDSSWDNQLDIKVFNLEGKLIQTWKEQAVNSQIVLPVNNLISGMYFYQINDGKQIASGKMIKQ